MVVTSDGLMLIFTLQPLSVSSFCAIPFHIDILKKAAAWTEENEALFRFRGISSLL